MNSIKLTTLLVTATVALGAVSQVTFAQGKTRAQVQQELVQARHDGVVPSSNTQYPPNDATIARNKEVHAAATHDGQVAHDVDHHDAVVAAR